MLLRNQDTELTLNLLGFEFPESAQGPVHDDWLVVAVTLRERRRHFYAAHTALALEEAHQLAAWLREQAFATTPASFVPSEGALAFEAQPLAGGCRLLVRLDLEFRPPWAGPEGACLEFVPGTRDVLALAASVHEAVQAFVPQGV